jgi:hypothetical protein
MNKKLLRGIVFGLLIELVGALLLLGVVHLVTH